ncbi:hypothetical protein NLJ89_g365 [Agrocybe chaxingu]|uniref:Major facilitator superfamily (MFS) profile domain-containing protein n=1 Tax=Agrocybe chaxingu TaxID=84603 RepID=A0A9W8TG50_9AGAR|nr:hypothetical protein NLJ89_g365 [Agrocybe chaxingu]
MADAQTSSPTSSLAKEKVEIGVEEKIECVENQDARRAMEKRLVRKVDLRMSILVLIYIMNYIDRNNASAARLATFEEDLGLVGSQFPAVIAIFLVGFILMQVPSNMLLNHIKRPSLYLPSAVFLWGLVSCLTGVTTNFAGVLVCRFFLGFIEAAFFPGALLLMSRWYKRDELGLRTSILYCGLLISVAFGNLIASGILTRMHGVLGHASWRWLYFIEGAITCVVALAAMFILPDFPEISKSWLTPEEQTLALDRIREDYGIDSSMADVNQFEGLKLAVRDWKVWWLTLAYTFIVLSVSYVLYLPTLAATLGYNHTISLLLCAPPSMLVAVTAFFHGRHSDKTQERCWHVSIPMFVAIVGHVIVISTMNTAARYFESSAKRAVALGIANSISQVGGIAGSFIYPDSWGPAYRPSFAINIVASAAVVFCAFVYRWHLSKLNKKAAAEEVARGQTVPGFRYTL